MPGEADIADTVKRACLLERRLCLVYKLLLESGARLSEVVKMLREYNPGLDKEHDGFYEYQLDWERGRKRALVIYHITPVEPGLFVNTESWVTHMSTKHGLVRPKYIRKFVATKMLELSIPSDVVDFMQGRVPRSVLQAHYLDRLVLARRYYPRYAAWVTSLYARIGV